jgi:predicted SAM-dependent methyltransferase
VPRQRAASLTIKQRIGGWLIPRLPVTRSLFDALRVEANGWAVRLRYAVLPPWRQTARTLRAARHVLVNVACGPTTLDGFINLDLFGAPPVVRWDCRRSLPLADGSARGVRVEHFFEHLDPRDEVPAFLAACHRALEPSGVLRIVVPDAAGYLLAYCAPDGEGFRALGVPNPFPDDLPTRMDVINHVFHQWGEHKWGYDFETLAHRLRAAGFTHIERSAFGRSQLGPLGRDAEHHAPYSLYVEAVKGP